MKDINFLKKENVLESLSKRKGSKNLMASICAVCTIAVVGIYICFIIYSVYLKVRINGLNKEIDGYGDVVAVQTESAKYKNSINMLSNIIKKNETQVQKSDTIKMIGEKCLPNISINSYNLTETGVLQLSGIGQDKETVIAFAESLRSSGYFKSVSLKSFGIVSETVDTNSAMSRYNFNIEITQ